MNQRVIATADRIYVKDPQGHAQPLQLGGRGGVKAGVRPDKHLRAAAVVGYDYGAAYDITGFVYHLQRDEGTGLVSFQLVAEVDVLYTRLPDPNDNGSGSTGAAILRSRDAR